MSVFKTPEIREEAEKKWNEAKFIDVVYVGVGRNAPINKFVIEAQSYHYAVNVEGWLSDSDCGICVDFYEIEDDFIEVVGISTVTVAWVEKKINATE